MTNAYLDLCAELQKSPKKWLVTGAAGFIGSNLLEQLLLLGQTVVCLDNFSTGNRENLAEVERLVGAENWNRCQFIEGDITDAKCCAKALEGVELVLHQAALGSVPRSIEDPLTSNKANVEGFLCLLFEAQRARVKRFVYASSSSVYGDEPNLPKVEAKIGNLLSPYAATKRINEIYADVFNTVYGIETIGLRYFNVFGPRQDPRGPYAAVIPIWVENLKSNQPCVIFGDGETSRDFCFVDNAVQANLLAATTCNPEAVGQVYNIALGGRTSLLELHGLLATELAASGFELQNSEPTFKQFRPGDVRHSLAETKLASERLGYRPEVTVEEGVRRSIAWYLTKKYQS